MIFIRLQEFDYAAASAIASVVLLVSLVLLFAINLWQARFLRRLAGR
jgi:sulfate transport system permease protein